VQVFAQPIVFFALSCVSELACSPAAGSVTHLRLRIPLREVVPSLVLPGPGRSFPSLTHLDLSTTNLRLHLHLPKLLDCFPKLETVVLDHTNLFGFLGADRLKGRECAAEMGRLVASHGIGRAKARERELAREAEARWRASRQRSAPPPTEPAAAGDDDSRLADELARLTTEEYPANGGRRRVVRSMAHSTFSLRPTSVANGRPGGPIPPPAPQEPYHPTVQAFVLPPLPTVRSIALGGEAPLSPADRKAWTADFDLGWVEGLGRLAEHALKTVGERVDRAARKAESDRLALERWLEKHGHATGADGQAGSVKPPAVPATHRDAKGKGRASASSSRSSATSPAPNGSSRPHPPAKVILYRYLTPAESRGPSPMAAAEDADDVPAGLVQVDRSTDWRTTYLNLLALTPSTLTSSTSGGSSGGCKLCLIPDELEGPLRRAGNGESSTTATTRLPTTGVSSAGLGSSSAVDSEVEDNDIGDDAEAEDDLEDESIDGAGGERSAASAHVPGCGHLVGRQIWDETV
jgi:hypothetical protein